VKRERGALKKLENNLHFTSCRVLGSGVKPILEVEKNSTFGNVVLLSPARSRFGQFRDHQKTGEMICLFAKSIGRGALAGDPNINGEIAI
jgi:UDP-N-acetylmuramoylalanine-D-glutamate ligase